MGNSKRKKDFISTIIIFLFPSLFFLILFIVYPIISSFQLSFFNWSGISPIKDFIGFGNWVELLKDRIFFKAVSNNFIIVILSIVTQIPIAMILAIFLDKGGKKVRVFKTIYFLPLLMSTVAVGFLFKYIYDPQFGMVPAFLRFIGLENLANGLLSNIKITLYSVTAIISWQWIPFYMIYFIAALTSIPTELHDAAVIDGADENKYFWKIVLPLLKGYVITAVVIILVGSLSYFDLIYVMTEGGPVHSTELMATYMYKNSFTSFRTGYGATIASAQFIISMCAALILFFLMKKKLGEVEN